MVPIEAYVAAVVQVAPAFLDLDRCLAIAEDAVAEAARAGARLVAFGESWLPGYPRWIDAGVAWEDPAAKRAYARLHANSVVVPGPATERLGRAAARHGVHLVMGATERDAAASRGSLYNTLLFFSDHGTLQGLHRKLVPTHNERLIWAQGDGSTLAVLETPLGRLGGLICWEHWMPLARFAMHAKGEQVHVAAWPDAPEIHHLASRSYAFEGRCYVVCACLYLPAEEIPDDFELRAAIAPGSSDLDMFRGGSGVIGPDGGWLAGPLVGEPGIVYAEIDPSRLVEEQLVLDTAGHYNRPDVFSLVVDETPRPQVTWARQAAEEPPSDPPPG